MHQRSLLEKLKEILSSRHIPRYAGMVVLLLGGLIIFSWHLHWRPVLQMLPGTAPMQYNTALCFILCAMGLLLHASRRAELGRWPGGIAAVFAFATLLEYLTGRKFGIDQLFFTPWFQADTVYSGRMSPLSAVCFILLGSTVVILSLGEKWRHRFTIAGALACIVCVIAFVALFGFILGIESAYGWGSYSRMAINTAVAFLVLATGLISHTWQCARNSRQNFLRWLPVTASVTLMVMVVFISILNLAELQDATVSRRNTIELILRTHAFEENLIDIQRGMRGYVTLGDTNALASFQIGIGLEPHQLDRLQHFTRENSAQAQRLKNLGTAINDLIAYDQREIQLYQRKGFSAVSKTDTTGESRKLFGNARDILQAFSREEQKLLELRQISEESDYQNITRLLVLGSAFAAVLLVFANQMATRELRQRRRVETKLLEITRLQNAILTSANYAIIALDSRGVVQTFNPAAERMLGYQASEVVGHATPILWRDPEEVAAQAERLSRELGRPVQPGVDILTAQAFQKGAVEYEVTFIRKDTTRFPVLVSLTALANEAGAITGFLGVIADITERKKNEAHREKLITELQQALNQVKTLSGMIPICGWCKSVRTDQGFWQTVEDYVRTRADVTFSHGMCPKCSEKFREDIVRANKPRDPGGNFMI